MPWMEEGWAAIGIDRDGEAMGAPGYHPRALLGVWLYGFMTVCDRAAS